MKMTRLLATMTAVSLAAWAFPVTNVFAEEGIPVYDETAYTEYVEATMKELDGLYLQFCAACGNDTTTAREAKNDFLTLVRELMQQMNQKFDALDPKKGAAMSPTDTLVSVHALTMVVDILAATQLEQMTAHPYIN